MLLKLITGSTAEARHESWKKRQFQAPHDGEAQTEERRRGRAAGSERRARAANRVGASQRVNGGCARRTILLC